MPAENIEECSEKICELHRVVVDNITEERDEYRKDSEMLKGVQKELDEIKQNASDENAIENKYNELKKEYDDYKLGVENEKAHSKKVDAYRQLLKSAGISEKRINSILKVTNVDNLEFDEGGLVKDSDKYTENIKSEWADFIETAQTEGASTANPPNNANNVTSDKRTGRAAELSKRYQESMYGVPKTNE